MASGRGGKIGPRNNGTKPRQQSSRTFKVLVSGDHCQRLMAAASERGVTPDQLLETLVRTVLEGGLVKRSSMTGRWRRLWRRSAAPPSRATRQSSGVGTP